jgi:DnaK suppressor protein
MTKMQFRVFRRSLKKKQAELGNGNGKREALAIETSPDALDRIQHAQERDFAMGTLDRGSKQLHEVQAALGRIDASTFGVCFDCGSEISKKRLAAVPWSALCIVCQEATERTGSPSQEYEQPLLSAA